MKKQLLFVFALLPMSCWSASFDCSDPKLTDVEKDICRSESASRLDTSLAALFNTRKSGARPAELTQLVSQQRAWLRERDDCPTEQCLIDSYNQRIHALLVQAIPSLLAGEWVTFLAQPVTTRITRTLMGPGPCADSYRVVDVRPYETDGAKSIVVEVEINSSPVPVESSSRPCQRSHTTTGAVELELDQALYGLPRSVYWYSCGPQVDVDRLFRTDALRTVCGGTVASRAPSR